MFLSSCDRDLELPIKVQLGSQASSCGESHNSAFLLSFQTSFIPPVEFRPVIWSFLRESVVDLGLPSCCEGILSVPLEPAKGNQDLSRAEGELSVLFPCSRVHRVPLEI